MTERMMLYVGTYTRREPHVHGKAAGMYVYTLHMNTGQLTYQTTVTGVENPSFLTLVSPVAPLPQATFLVAVHELAGEGVAAGEVSAFAIEPTTGDLTFLNQQPSLGDAPCYVSSDAAGRHVLVANYVTGTVCVLPLMVDGRLAPVSDRQQHQGAGPTSRQEGPHAHCIVPDGYGRFLAADLGADPQQTISLLPSGYTGFSTGAHIQASPDGKFLYTSNRGHDSLVIYAIDEATGILTLVGHEFTQGKTPRHFTMDADGRFLLAANQDSDTVVVFRRDEETGGLTAVSSPTPIPTPVCLQLLPLC